MSCTAGSACTAVGWITDIGGSQVTLAERWNGTSWSVQATPTPTGIWASALHGVSCSSATACEAVGYFTLNDGSQLTLAETWNGTSWSVQATPNPSGATSSDLLGVSCTSVSVCRAVGDYIDVGGTMRTLAERWNGSSWSIQVTPNPAGATASVLNGVSCTAGAACIAVGDSTDTGGSQATLAERWNGSSWSIRPMPSPVGATQSRLAAISCTTATACEAVGDFTVNDGSQLTVAERWNGTDWSIQASPNVVGAPGSILTGVSCASAVACTAIGYVSIQFGSPLTLAERWNGTNWSIQATPNPVDFSGVLSGVSCSSATVCIAVGATFGPPRGHTLGERWNGTKWSLQVTASPDGARSSSLLAISCSSVTLCTAVGQYTRQFGPPLTLAERWDGTSWSIQTTPNPADLNSFLDGVSCPSATVCIAVGTSFSPDVTQALVERWDGTSWSIQTIPSPVGATQTRLAAISCKSATVCKAVGDYTINDGSQRTLAESWNGTSWALQATPNPAGANASLLRGISCTTAAACTAVGDSTDTGGSDLTLAERWNGTSWSLQTTRNPVATTTSVLEGISCTSATVCKAVGYYNDDRGKPKTLAERWNGTNWSIQNPPGSVANQDAELLGLSCTSSSACTAVGAFGTPTGTQTLAERWDGISWSVESTLDPAGIFDNVLQGISCTSATVCTAVGSFRQSGVTGVPLAERSA